MADVTVTFYTQHFAALWMEARVGSNDDPMQNPLDPPSPIQLKSANDMPTNDYPVRTDAAVNSLIFWHRQADPDQPMGGDNWTEWTRYDTMLGDNYVRADDGAIQPPGLQRKG